MENNNNNSTVYIKVSGEDADKKNKQKGPLSLKDLAAPLRSFLGTPKNSPIPQEILKLIKLRRYQKGAKIYDPQKQASEIMWIVNGKTGFFLKNDAGGDIKIKTLGKNQLIGGLAYITGKTENISAAAVEPCLMLVLPYDKVDEISIKYPSHAPVLLQLYLKKKFFAAASNCKAMIPLSDTEKLEASSLFKFKTFKQNKNIIEQGKTTDILLLLLEGEATAVPTAELPQKDFYKGMFIGAASFLSGSPAKQNVKTKTPVLTAVLDRSSWNTFSSKYSAAAASIEKSTAVQPEVSKEIINQVVKEVAEQPQKTASPPPSGTQVRLAPRFGVAEYGFSATLKHETGSTQASMVNVSISGLLLKCDTPPPKDTTAEVTIDTSHHQWAQEILGTPTLLCKIVRSGDGEAAMYITGFKQGSQKQWESFVEGISTRKAKRVFYPRYDVAEYSIPVNFLFENDIAAAKIINISRTGMLIKGDVHPPAGTLLKFRIRPSAPGSKIASEWKGGDIAVTAMVVREEIGEIGVDFHHEDEISERKLAEFVTFLAEKKRADAPLGAEAPTPSRPAVAPAQPEPEELLLDDSPLQAAKIKRKKITVPMNTARAFLQEYFRHIHEGKGFYPTKKKFTVADEVDVVLKLNFPDAPAKGGELHLPAVVIKSTQHGTAVRFEPLPPLTRRKLERLIQRLVRNEEHLAWLKKRKELSKKLPPYLLGRAGAEGEEEPPKAWFVIARSVAISLAVGLTAFYIGTSFKQVQQNKRRIGAVIVKSKPTRNDRPKFVIQADGKAITLEYREVRDVILENGLVTVITKKGKKIPVTDDQIGKLPPNFQRKIVRLRAGIK